MKAMSILGFYIATLFVIFGRVHSVCYFHCDGLDSYSVSGPTREPVELHLNGRRLTLVVYDHDNMAFARVYNRDGLDEVWVDRTFDGGRSWEELLGRTSNDQSSMFNVDDPNARRVGALRACGNLGGQTTCTSWARSVRFSEGRVDAAVTAMMMYYEPLRGLWTTIGWWNSATAFTALIHYQLITGRNHYESTIDTTFELNKGRNEFGGENFCSGSIDDTLWWGLAWVKAYDLTRDRKYLDMAVIIADYSYRFHDEECGGGLWVSDQIGLYKNAVVNEQYILLSAQLHNRLEGDTKFLEQSQRLWNWFKNIGMINEENLINDGLFQCGNNHLPTWTYNQGIILGGLAELYRATGSREYLNDGRSIADAVIASGDLNDEDGILREPPGAGCQGPDPNCACFKGIFMRFLQDLNQELDGRPYSSYILKQADEIYNRNRNSIDQYGLNWSGPLDMVDASRQQSAVDALLAAEAVRIGK